MATEIEATNGVTVDLLKKVLIGGDLSGLTGEEQLLYYRKVCESTGLNHLTKPFAFLKLQGTLQLYALKAATDQLRAIHHISIPVVRTEVQDGLCIVTVTARDATGRTDTDVGVVPVEHLKGEARANAIMKSVTKGKRRVTLSMCGMGMLDESEVGSIPGAEVIDVESPAGARTEATLPVLPPPELVPEGEAPVVADFYGRLWRELQLTRADLAARYGLEPSDIRGVLEAERLGGTKRGLAMLFDRLALRMDRESLEKAGPEPGVDVEAF